LLIAGQGERQNALNEISRAIDMLQTSLPTGDPWTSQALALKAKTESARD
jgi:hypothetical protein